jgi:hypothetical protein
VSVCVWCVSVCVSMCVVCECVENLWNDLDRLEQKVDENCHSDSLSSSDSLLTGLRYIGDLRDDRL